MTKEDIIVKVQKILNLASNNSSKQESEAAMAKAQELLLKYDLSMNDIELAKEEISSEEFGEVNKSKLLIASVLATFFRVTLVYRLDYHYVIPKKIGTCIGNKLDIAVFKNVFEFCWKYYQNSLHEFAHLFKLNISMLKMTGDNLVYKNGNWVEDERYNITDREIEDNYAAGFISGLHKKFSENTNRFALQIRISQKHEDKLEELGIKQQEIKYNEFVRKENTFISYQGFVDGQHFKKDNKQLKTKSERINESL
jgi:hypothetical protein